MRFILFKFKQSLRRPTNSLHDPLRLLNSPNQHLKNYIADSRENYYMRSWVLRVKFHLVSCCIQRKSLHISAQQMISVLLPSPRSQLFYLLPQLKNKQWYCRHEPEINTTLRIIKFSKEEIYQPLTPKISPAILLTTGHIILDVSSENLVLDQLIIP